MSRKVLITGGRSKFVPELVALLRRNKDRIAIITKSSELDLGSDIDYFKCDLSGNVALDYCPDVVVHLAASVPYNRNGLSVGSAYEVVRENVMSFVNTIKFSVSKGVKKFVFISSTDVYPILNENIISEDTQVNPGNFYGCSKLACERIGLAYKNLSDISLSILRLGPVYGSGMERNLKIWALLDEVKRGNQVTLYNANNVLSLLPIRSASEAIFKSIEASPGLFNVAGLPVTLDEFIRTAYEFYGFESEILYSRQQELSCRLVFDLSKAKDLLDWYPLEGFCF